MAKLKVAAMKFNDNYMPVVYHGSPKCNALVAATNVALLEGSPISDPHQDFDRLDSDSLTKGYVKGVQEFRTTSASLRQQMEGKTEILQDIARSLDGPTVLDPRNSSCQDFLDSDVCTFFKIIDLEVVHGWVLDPKDTDLASVLGIAHSQLAGKIAELAEANGVDHPLVQKLDSFRNAPLTIQGLHSLQKGIKKGKLAVLYSNNEYNVVCNYLGDIFSLEACEEKREKFPTAVWKKLSVEEDKSFYVTSDFTPSYDQPKERLALADEWFVPIMQPRRGKNQRGTNRHDKKKESKKESSSESISEVCPHKDAADDNLGCTDSDNSTSKKLTLEDRFLLFLSDFRDGSSTKNLPHFEGIAKGMVATGSFKLYIPFQFIQSHDKKLAMDIQDQSPGIHNELVKSVVTYLTKHGADKDEAKKHADLLILNLPEPKCIQKFVEFVSWNELVVPCKLYDGQDDVMTTPIGRDMGLGYLNYIFDRFEEGRCWSEGWVLDEMETRNKGTEFIITKEPNADLNDELGVQNLCLYANTIFPYYKIGGLHPAFFDAFYRDILVFPKEHKKNTEAWKRFVRYMRSFLGLKAPVVRSTLICEFHRLIALEVKLHPSMYTLVRKKGKDWRDGLVVLKPFNHVYLYRNRAAFYFGGDKWEACHEHVLKYTRHFIEHILIVLKAIILLHDLHIVELIAARKLDSFISDAIRTIVLEYGVDGVFRCAWDHFENSNSKTMPLQFTHEKIIGSEIIAGSSDLSEVKLLIRVSPIKSGDQKTLWASSEVCIPHSDSSPEMKNPRLIDLKQVLESKSFQVEQSDDLIHGDCIVISSIIKSKECQITVQGPMGNEYISILDHIRSWLCPEVDCT